MNLDHQSLTVIANYPCGVPGVYLDDQGYNLITYHLCHPPAYREIEFR